MSVRAEKESLCGEILNNLRSSDFLFLANFQGMTVERMTELRRRLRGNGSRMQVVANSLLKRAIGECGMVLEADCLVGPTAMVWGTGDATLVAKDLQLAVREWKVPTAKGGWLEGRPLCASDVEALADMPPRDTMRAIAVGTIAAPLARLVGVMSAKLASLVYVLKAVEEKKGSKA